MTTAHIIAGDLAANIEDRVVTGLLVPYGEVGQTNLGKFTIDGPGVISIPPDLSVLNANEYHKPTEPRARFLTITDTPAGMVVALKIGTNPEGDTLLAEIARKKAAGTPKALSVEVKDMVIRAGKAVSGMLTGAGFVDRGAFPSAILMAAAVDTDEEIEVDPDADPDTTTEDPAPIVEKFSEEFTDETGTHKRTTTTTTTVKGNTTTIETETVIEDPEEETPVPAAAVPTTLLASRPAKSDAVDLPTLYAAISAAAQDPDNSVLMAALADVKFNGTNAFGTGVVQPEFIGKMWAGRGFVRRVIPLLTPGTLTKFASTGYRVLVGPAVDVWAGNKAEIPTNSPTTEAVPYTSQRFAGGWDIAREFVDFGETEVIADFFRLAVDDYARKSDAYALAQIKAAATTGVVGTIPTGVGSGIAKIVRGALRVLAADAMPTFAIVAPDVYEQIIFTKEIDRLAFLNMALGLEEGTIAEFKIVSHTGMAAGTVLVGAKPAVKALELSDTPIRVSAMDLAKGGTDEALFGYVQIRPELPAALQLVTN